VNPSLQSSGHYAGDLLRPFRAWRRETGLVRRPQSFIYVLIYRF